MTAKAKRITWISLSAVLAALVIVIAVFCFVRVSDGFNTGEKPFAIQVAKNGLYSEKMADDGKTNAALYRGTEAHAGNYNKLVKDYYGMTSYIAMRGIVENRWFPKAKLEEVVFTESEISLLSAAADKDGKPGYLLTLVYDKPQSAEVKVAKGTKDNPNVIKIDIDEYKEGEKVAFTFTSIVVAIEENNFIGDLTVYAFEKELLGKPEFAAYKITVQANRMRLYNDCIRLLP